MRKTKPFNLRSQFLAEAFDKDTRREDMEHRRLRDVAESDPDEAREMAAEEKAVRR